MTESVAAIPNTQVDTNLPEDVENRAQVFLSLLKENPNASNYKLGQQLAAAGVYKNCMSVYDLLEYPVISEEAKDIRQTAEDFDYHISIKGKVLLDRKIDEIARTTHVSDLDKEDKDWIKDAIACTPRHSGGVAVQVNIEDRRRTIQQRAQAARSVGGNVLLKGETG